MRLQPLAVACLATALSFANATAAAPAAASDTIDARPRSTYEAQVEQALARAHDDARAEVGAGLLAVWSDIRAVARGWSEELDVTEPCDRNACHNVPPASAVPYHEEYGCHVGYGENVAWRSGRGDPPAPVVLADLVMTQWRNSDTHQQTLTHAGFDEVGIGVQVRAFVDPQYGPAWEVWVTVDFRDRDQDCDPPGVALSEQDPPADADPNPDPATDSGDSDTSTTGPTTTAPERADDAGGDGDDGEDGLPRLAGEDRIGTAVASATTFLAANTVIIASSADYPDALAAAPLAGALDAPVLLAQQDTLDPRVRDEIARLRATRVILVGGPNALGTGLAETVADIDGVAHVERIAGDSRWDTAARLAERVVAETANTGNVILVEGANPDPRRGWPDALAASSVAARTATPILLTLADGIPGPTADALRAMDLDGVLIVGGESAVTAATQREAGVIADAGTARWAGDNRFTTSIEVDRRSNLDSSAVLLATGLGWADALSAGPAAAHLDATLLLIHGQDAAVAAQTADWIREAHPGEDVLLVGGRSAISTPVASSLR